MGFNSGFKGLTDYDREASIMLRPRPIRGLLRHGGKNLAMNNTKTTALDY